MYTISEVIEVILFLIFLRNINSIIYELLEFFPNMYEKVNARIIFLNKILELISENNPLLLDYYEPITNEELKEELTVVSKTVEEKEKEKEKEKYEDKYLEKFKRFPNEFQFSELELEEEKKEFENVKNTTETNRNKLINDIKEQLDKIDEIEKEHKLTCELNENVTENINTLCKKGLLSFFDLDYILECTPLGNIYMRYNNSKKSFEYFSNSTMPYRYLEPVGRKYVMTYWCKPIFIDIEDELKKSEQKFEEEKKKKEEDDKRMEEDLKSGQGTGPKNMIAKLKNYNKDTKNQANMKPQMKNRSGSNFVLPPQIKANLPSINQKTEKQYLKENANRYTCEGRLTGFSPLKKIDKKVSDKKLAMSYADFKRMQKEEQNKK